MSQKIKIVVYIQGGACQSVASDCHPDLIDLVVLDLDDAKEEGLTEEQAAASCTFQDGSSVADLIPDINYLF